MKRFLVNTALILLITTVFTVAAAQIEPRVTIDASINNNALGAFSFNPDAQITVNGVEAATIEGAESTHSCLTPASAGGYSVWFKTYLMPGTITLNTTGSQFTTAGGPVSDTVISLYRFQDTGLVGFDSFVELTPVACDDGIASPGVITNLSIVYEGLFYVQISAAPSVIATGTSSVSLNAQYTAAINVPYDEPDNAKSMKLPNLPSIANISSATLSLNEPVDPFAFIPVTNTVWAKFTLTSQRTVGFQNFYFNSGSLFFSLFTKSGPNYIPALGTIFSFPNVMLATLNPGEYYLRIGIVGQPQGTSSTFITFTGIAYLMPPNYNFSVGLTEGTSGATPSLAGWTVNNAAGDDVGCDPAPPYTCSFRFISSGAGENTVLKTSVGLSAVKVKKGDVIRFQPSLNDISGLPNLKAKLILRDALGNTQKYVFFVTDDQNTEPNLTAVVPTTFKPIKAKLKFKNKDTDSGDFIEIDGIVVAALRVGESLRGPMNIPLFGEVNFDGATSTLLPVPAPK